MYPAVILMYFITAADCLVSFALIVQISQLYIKIGRTSEMHNVIPVFLMAFCGLNTLFKIPVARISTFGCAPVIQVSFDNEPPRFLVDTGSSVCLMRANASSVGIQATAIAPNAITVDMLPLQGEQLIQFRLGIRQCRSTFGV
jgi:hypothetical protein